VDPIKLKAIIDAIEDNGPRNAMGELMGPYLGWVVAIRRDLALYERWRKSAAGQREIFKKGGADAGKD